METVETLQDDLRVAQQAKKHLEKTQGLYRTDESGEIRKCEATIREISERLAFAIDNSDLEESYGIQNSLVVRYAKRHRMSDDNAAWYWQKHYSADFRRLWNQKIRTIPELEHELFTKTGL